MMPLEGDTCARSRCGCDLYLRVNELGAFEHTCQSEVPFAQQVIQLDTPFAQLESVPVILYGKLDAIRGQLPRNRDPLAP